MTDDDVGSSREEATDAATSPSSGTDSERAHEDATGQATADERVDASQKTAEPSDSGDDSAAESGGRRGRDVIVPMPIYKVVTVFSTLIAVVGVVLGFMLLDAATLNVSFLGNTVRGVFTVLGVGVADGLLSVVFAAVGLAMIAFGAGVYVLGTRFRARGMGNAQEGSDEASNNDG